MFYISFFCPHSFAWVFEFSREFALWDDCEMEGKIGEAMEEELPFRVI